METYFLKVGRGHFSICMFVGGSALRLSGAGVPCGAHLNESSKRLLDGLGQRGVVAGLVEIRGLG